MLIRQGLLFTIGQRYFAPNWRGRNLRLRLLRLCGTPKHEEHSAKTKDRDFLLHFFSLPRSTRHSTPAPFSFDHFIRPRQHIRWNRQTDLFCGFQIDHKLKLRGLLDWKIRRLGALEDFIHESRQSSLQIYQVRPVRHEAASFDKLCVIKGRREAALYCQVNDSFSLTNDEGISH